MTPSLLFRRVSDPIAGCRGGEAHHRGKGYRGARRATHPRECVRLRFHASDLVEHPSVVVRAGHAATPHLSLERASSTGIFEHLRLPRAARNGLVVNARVHRGSAAGKRRTSSLLFGSSRGRKRGARRSPEEAGDGAEGLGEMSVSRARFCLVVVSTVFSPPFRLPLQWYRRLFTRSLFDTSAGVPTEPRF